MQNTTVTRFFQPILDLTADRRDSQNVFFAEGEGREETLLDERFVEQVEGK